MFVHGYKFCEFLPLGVDYKQVYSSVSNSVRLYLIHPEEGMDVCSKVRGNLSNICWDISLEIKTLEEGSRPQSRTARVVNKKQDSDEKEMNQMNLPFFLSQRVEVRPRMSCPFSVVVAIDFGTTSSGYAFSFTQDSEAIHMMK